MAARSLSALLLSAMFTTGCADVIVPEGGGGQGTGGRDEGAGGSGGASSAPACDELVPVAGELLLAPPADDGFTVGELAAVGPDVYVVHGAQAPSNPTLHRLDAWGAWPPADASFPPPALDIEEAFTVRANLEGVALLAQITAPGPDLLRLYPDALEPEVFFEPAPQVSGELLAIAGERWLGRTREEAGAPTTLASYEGDALIAQRSDLACPPDYASMASALPLASGGWLAAMTSSDDAAGCDAEGGDSPDRVRLYRLTRELDAELLLEEVFEHGAYFAQLVAAPEGAWLITPADDPASWRALRLDASGQPTGVSATFPNSGDLAVTAVGESLVIARPGEGDGVALDLVSASGELLQTLGVPRSGDAQSVLRVQGDPAGRGVVLEWAEHAWSDLHLLRFDCVDAP